MKVCIKCKKELPCTLEFFHADKNTKDKLHCQCKKCRSAVAKRYHIKNREQNIKREKEWRAKNKEKIRIRRKKYRIKEKKLRCNDSKFHLNRNISISINKSLFKKNKNKRHWEALVGYTLKDLRKHIEKQFTEGMFWENYGKWHIDHEIPISAHNFTKPEHEDFKKCWALSNLQPMWAKENMSKGARLTKPFQQSLLM